MILLKYFKKIEEQETLLNSSYKATITLIIKTRKGTAKTENIFDDKKYKDSQH